MKENGNRTPPDFLREKQAKDYLFITAFYLQRQGVPPNRRVAIMNEVASRMLLPDGWQDDVKMGLADCEEDGLDLSLYDETVRKMIYRDAVLSQRAGVTGENSDGAIEDALVADLHLNKRDAEKISAWVGKYVSWLADTERLVGIDTVDRHLDTGMRKQYLGVLVYVMNVDGEAAVEERELIRKIATELHVSRSSARDVASSPPEWKEVSEFVQGLENRFVRLSLYKDVCAVVHADCVIHERETEAMEKIRGVVGLGKGDAEGIFQWTGRYFTLTQEWFDICGIR